MYVFSVGNVVKALQGGNNVTDVVTDEEGGKHEKVVRRFLRLDELAVAMGSGNVRADVFDLRRKLQILVDAAEVSGGDAPITFVPHRERVRYGLPESLTPVEAWPMPEAIRQRKRSAGAAAEKKEGKQYLPYIALGVVVPTETATSESVYDGRWDVLAVKVAELLASAGINHNGVKGRAVRGGSGIYIALE